MGNTFLIAKREYLERVRTKAFIVTTILFPVIMMAMFGLPALLASGPLSHSSEHLVVVASNAEISEAIARQLRLAGQRERQEVQGRLGLSRRAGSIPGQFVVDTSNDL